MQLLAYGQISDFDSINFRVISSKSLDGKQFFTLVEEKIRDGKVVADLRRQFDAATFALLQNAVAVPKPKDTGYQLYIEVVDSYRKQISISAFPIEDKEYENNHILVKEVDTNSAASTSATILRNVLAAKGIRVSLDV